MATKQIILNLDKKDYKAVVRCIATREGFLCMPDGESDLNGAAIAEICRGWEEMLDAASIE